MTVLELKAEIIKAIDDLPEKRLPEILEHIKHLQQKENFKRIIEEDAELLRRLAK